MEKFGSTLEILEFAICSLATFSKLIDFESYSLFLETKKVAEMLPNYPSTKNITNLINLLQNQDYSENAT